MIKVEGFKAFRGSMRITPKTDKVQPFVITCDWLYKPDTNCWYGNGSSYSSEICEVICDCDC